MKVERVQGYETRVWFGYAMGRHGEQDAGRHLQKVVRENVKRKVVRLKIANSKGLVNSAPVCCCSCVLVRISLLDTNSGNQVAFHMRLRGSSGSREREWEYREDAFAKEQRGGGWGGDSTLDRSGFTTSTSYPVRQASIFKEGGRHNG